MHLIFGASKQNKCDFNVKGNDRTISFILPYVQLSPSIAFSDRSVSPLIAPMNERLKRQPFWLSDRLQVSPSNRFSKKALINPSRILSIVSIIRIGRYELSSPSVCWASAIKLAFAFSISFETLSCKQISERVCIMLDRDLHNPIRNTIWACALEFPNLSAVCSTSGSVISDAFMESRSSKCKFSTFWVCLGKNFFIMFSSSEGQLALGLSHLETLILEVCTLRSKVFTYFVTQSFKTRKFTLFIAYFS